MPRQSRCANSLLLSWLEEWRDEQEPESNKYLMYKKAARSLKEWPTVLDHPRDSIEVKFIGPSIRDKLVKRYKQHCDAEDGPVSQSSGPNDSSPAAPSKRKNGPAKAAAPKKRGRLPKRKPADSDSEMEDQPAIQRPPPAVNPSRPNQFAIPPLPTANAAPVSIQNEVIPGQFLFWYIDTENRRVKKRDQAAVHILPAEGALSFKMEYRMDQSLHEVARTLLYKEATPPGRERDKSTTFFAYIKEGHAERFENCTAMLNSVSQSAASLLTRPRTMTIDPSRMMGPEYLDEMEKARAAVRERAAQKAALLPDRQPIPRQDSQSSFGSSTGSVSQKAAAAATLRRQSSQMDISIPSSSVPKAAAGSNKGIPDRRAAPPDTESNANVPFPESNWTFDDTLLAAGPSHARAPFRLVTNEAIHRMNTAPAALPKPIPVAAQAAPPLNRASTFPGSQPRNGPRLSNHIPAPAPVDELEAELDFASGHAASYTVPSVMGQFPPFQPVIIPAGTYTISLVLDNREVKNQSQREYISDGLRRKGVCVDKRALALGDVTWIARRNTHTGSEYDECVLDFVLERKRMDDLCSSIKDGRFHEQKFRLHTSGISRIYYLVEDYNKEKHKDQFGIQMNTALSSTQIVDGFFVKETKSLDDTIEYLSGVHATVLELHEGKTLHVIPAETIRPNSYQNLQRHLRETKSSITHLTTYSTFHNLNGKSTNMTLRDQWARMLLCIKGLSAEKVATIIENYDTPNALWGAFKYAEFREAADIAKEQQGGDAAPKKRGKSTVRRANMLLTELEATGRKKIGEAMSQKIYELFMSYKY